MFYVVSTTPPRSPLQRTSRTLWIMSQRLLQPMPELEPTFPMPSREASHLTLLTGTHRACMTPGNPHLFISQLTINHVICPLGPPSHTSAMDADAPRHMELFPEEYGAVAVQQLQQAAAALGPRSLGMVGPPALLEKIESEFRFPPLDCCRSVRYECPPRPHPHL